MLVARSRRDKSFLPADVLFLGAAAMIAWLACTGILPVSGDGAIMDSDLQTYAQGMAGAGNRDLFLNDPVLHSTTPANSIPNLERILGGYLAPAGHWATGLLIAGSLAIFIFYAGWYFLGRWLYKSPALAALLAFTCGITVWVGWGTFWGITHSEPVPRVFFGALMPYLLLLAFIGIQKTFLRPLVMFLAGLAIWVHGVSALNFGAMIFLGYLILKPKDCPIKMHIYNLIICLCAFFLPVLIFLWPSLTQGGKFSTEELAVFHNLFELRWREDYSDYGKRLKSFFSYHNDTFPILAGGIAGWLVLVWRGSQREKMICKLAPCYLAALLLVAAFCWLETKYAPAFGRLPMGHELVRGLRFLVPLAWILAVGGAGCLLTGKVARRIVLTCVIIAIFAVSKDKQLAAAQFALSEKTGINLPLAESAKKDKMEAEKWRAVLETIRKIVPEGESIYCPEDAMQIRYIAMRPLIHSFKDGYVHFYNKDLQASKKWLELEQLRASGSDGYLKAWQKSGSNWLLCRANADKTAILTIGAIEMDKNGWLLVRKKDPSVIRPSDA